MDARSPTITSRSTAISGSGKLLVACDYEVVAVANGKDALTQLKGENKFDLVLSDIFMPEVSGVELLESLQKQSELANNAAEKEAGVAPSSSHDDRPQQTTDWQQVPVIVMSSQDKQDTVMKCFKLGAADFLVKPVRRNELKNLWQHVWRQAQQQNNNGIAAPQSDAELGEPRTPSPTSTDSTAELLMSMSGEKRKKDASRKPKGREQDVALDRRLLRLLRLRILRLALRRVRVAAGIGSVAVASRIRIRVRGGVDVLEETAPRRRVLVRRFAAVLRPRVVVVVAAVRRARLRIAVAALRRRRVTVAALRRHLVGLVPLDRHAHLRHVLRVEARY